MFICSSGVLNYNIVLEFSQLYLVTKYCDDDKKKGTQHRYKCHKNLYLHEKRGGKRIVLANSRFTGNLSERSVCSVLMLINEKTVAEPINMSTPQMNYVNEEQPKQYEGTKVR